jgi:hypothetical protein
MSLNVNRKVKGAALRVLGFAIIFDGRYFENNTF